MNIVLGVNKYGEAQGNSFDSGESMSVNSLEETTRSLARQSVASPPYTPNTSVSEGHPMSDGSVGSVRSLGDAQSAEKHFYFPIDELKLGPPIHEIQALIDVRNLFAFFSNQPIVATRRYPTQFRTFLSIAAMLKKFEFTNFDGSTFGEAAVPSFGRYLEEEQLADVRDSRQATLEGLILGEAMRSVELYNEAFSHATGKWDAIKEMKSPLFNELSATTRTRLENSSRQLKTRVHTVNERLIAFEFPSLFAGIGSSATSTESKLVRFKSWKVNFERFRKAFLSYYTSLYGQWPPKASSKKNNFTLSGLNRLVLKALYDDLSMLYDYMVDRKSLTTRAHDTSGDQHAPDVPPAAAALRKLLGEFDDSSPPVQPPIPFDVPLIPTMATVDATFPLLSPKDMHKKNTQKLKDHEAALILNKACNWQQTDIGTPFMDMYKKFELKEARGKNVQDLVEQRFGHWVFLYAVIQSLPLLVVDAPDLQFTKGVEYFLCQPPLGVSPWIEEAARGIQMSLYEVKGTGGYTLLPDDMVNHGVEATFRRSHCWEMAEKWIGSDTEPASQPSVHPLSPLSPPPQFGSFGGVEMGYRPTARSSNRSSSGTDPRPQSASPTLQPRSRTSSRQDKRYSVALGLEKLPVPPSGFDYADDGSPIIGNSRPTSRSGSPMIGPGGRRNSSFGVFDNRPASATTNTGATFDDILCNIPGQEDVKKGKK
jgi:hypothetical protein